MQSFWSLCGAGVSPMNALHVGEKKNNSFDPCQNSSNWACLEKKQPNGGRIRIFHTFVGEEQQLLWLIIQNEKGTASSTLPGVVEHMARHVDLTHGLPAWDAPLILVIRSRHFVDFRAPCVCVTLHLQWRLFSVDGAATLSCPAAQTTSETYVVKFFICMSC